MSTQVSCLVCNLKVAVSSTKNIFKTAFAQTGENLAPFVSTTLSTPTTDLRSSSICLQCLGLFGKLEEAQRKVKSIKYEIEKTFINSYGGKISSHSIIEKAKKDVTAGKSQVPMNKLRAIITQCTKKKSAHIIVKKEQVGNQPIKPIKSETANAAEIIIEEPTVDNLIKSTNLEAINTGPKQKKSHKAGYRLVPLELLEKSLNAGTNVPSQSSKDEVVNLDDYDIEFKTDDNTDDLSPSLQDHQYTQLPSINQIVIQKKPTPALKLKKESTTTSKLEKQNCELKKPKVPKPKSNTGSERKTKLKDLIPNNEKKIPSEPAIFICEKCGKIYKSHKALKLHLKIHDDSPYTCATCKQTFTHRSSLKKHLPKHTGEKPYECQLCQKRFTYKTSYKMHILSHTQEKSHKCDLCFMTFRSTSHLNRHKRIHTGDKQHGCAVCGRRFFERYNLTAHMKVHNSPENNRPREVVVKKKRVPQRRCEKCQINFATMGEYNVHLHSHTADNVMDLVNGIKFDDPDMNDAWQSISSS